MDFWKLYWVTVVEKLLRKNQKGGINLGGFLGALGGQYDGRKTVYDDDVYDNNDNINDDNDGEYDNGDDNDDDDDGEYYNDDDDDDNGKYYNDDGNDNVDDDDVDGEYHNEDDDNVDEGTN